MHSKLKIVKFPFYIENEKLKSYAQADYCLAMASETKNSWNSFY